MFIWREQSSKLLKPFKSVIFFGSLTLLLSLTNAATVLKTIETAYLPSSINSAFIHTTSASDLNLSYKQLELNEATVSSLVVKR